ncbi:MAG: type II toxin-antitoxin system PemK/MazF family toxin [Candidatus Rokubacteria bacterium]|nr:type II toxin-antitoxin system PemK/MazF family toxin [Candidatus Rokubacteria bacterium]
MSVRKWDLAWALLDPTVGHEQAGRRPVLVFCNDVIASPIGLTTVLPLTTWRKGRRVYPTEVLLISGTGGLPAASLVLTHQVRTISARRLSPAMGSLGDPARREQVATALRLWLDLGGN